MSGAVPGGVCSRTARLHKSISRAQAHVVSAGTHQTVVTDALQLFTYYYSLTRSLARSLQCAPPPRHRRRFRDRAMIARV